MGKRVALWKIFCGRCTYGRCPCACIPYVWRIHAFVAPTSGSAPEPHKANNGIYWRRRAISFLLKHTCTYTLKRLTRFETRADVCRSSKWKERLRTEASHRKRHRAVVCILHSSSSLFAKASSTPEDLMRVDGVLRYRLKKRGVLRFI